MSVLKAIERENDMEEMHRTHKEVPFGWMALVLKVLAVRPKTKAQPIKATPAPWGVRISRG